MIYFSLPNLYNHIYLQIAISNLKKDVNIMKAPVQFVSAYESIPFCYLDGGVNVNKDHIFTYSDLQHQFKFSNMVKRLDFSNLYIDSNDLKDEYFNLILQGYNNSSNWIDISNIQIAIDLKNKNIPFDLIFSSNADILSSFSTDIINTIIEQKIFKLISLPAYIDFNKFNLKDIEHKKYLELTINNICKNCSENCQKECIKKEHNSIYNYSNRSYYMNCSNFISYNDISNTNISLKDIQEKYLPLGITHYKLNSFPNIPNAFIDFIFFFVNYFIKEEYQNEILIKLLKENQRND